MALVSVIAAIAAACLAWWWMSRMCRARGHKVGVRHAMAGTVSVCAFVIVLLLLVAPSGQPAAETASSESTATEEAPVQPLPVDTPNSGQPEDPLTLAKETADFLVRSQETIGYAVAANDGVAIRDEVEMPAWRLLMRWSDLGSQNFGAYEPCYEALAAMESYADRLSRADSADRRRALDYDAQSFDRNWPQCQQAVEPSGDGAAVAAVHGIAIGEAHV